MRVMMFLTRMTQFLSTQFLSFYLNLPFCLYLEVYYIYINIYIIIYNI